MPNRPMTATRLTPRNSCRAEGHAQLAGHGVHADAGEQQADDIEMTVLCLASRPRPTNEQKVRRYTAKNSGGPNFSANEEIIGARKVISITATSEPMNDEVKAAVRRRRPALLRHRIAVEGGRHRPGLAGDVEQDRGDGAAEQRPPIDAGQHHDRRGRVHRERQRQQDRHAVGTAEAGQHADENAEHQPEHHQSSVFQVSSTAKPCIKRPKASIYSFHQNIPSCSSLRAKRSNPSRGKARMDCFVAFSIGPAEAGRLLAMTEESCQIHQRPSAASSRPL